MKKVIKITFRVILIIICLMILFLLGVFIYHRVMLSNKASDKIENTMKKILDKEGYRMFDAGGRRIGSLEAEVLTLKGVAKSMKLPNVKGLPMRNKSIYKIVEKRILGDNVESMLTSGFSTIIGRVVG